MCLFMHIFLLYFFLFFYIDLCVKVTCNFYATCLTRNSQTHECVCPICGDEQPYAPLCGDNGKTYANECWMRRDSCILQKNLNAVKNEPCGVDGKLDIVFAVDASKYVDQNIMGKMKDFVRSSIDSYNISPANTRIGMVLYNNQQVKQILPLSIGISEASINQALLSMSPMGGMKGLRETGNYIFNQIFTRNNQEPNRKRILVLLTTGLEQTNSIDNANLDLFSIQNFQNLKTIAGVDIVSMVIGDEGFLPDAYKISKSKRDVIFVNGFSEIPGALGDVEALIGYTQGKRKTL